MKKIILSILLMMTMFGCMNGVVSQSYHEVLAQKAALEDEYPGAQVQIVLLKRDSRIDESFGVRYHTQARVKLDGKWFYLSNIQRYYHLFNGPKRDFKVFKIEYDNMK